MYNGLDIVEIAKNTALTRVLDDRKRYLPYLQQIKDFIIENNIYVLQDIDLDDINGYRYTLFTYNAIKIAKKLCDKLFNSDDIITRYVKVITKIKYYKFSIVLDDRELCTITDIPNYRNARISDIIDKIEGYKNIFEINTKILEA
jgi:hypothetical protein